MNAHSRRAAEIYELLGLNVPNKERPYDPIAEAIEAAIMEERELSAQTAEWEHAHGTNGIGIAAAIRRGHLRRE